MKHCKVYIVQVLGSRFVKLDAIAEVDAADIAETPDHFVAAKNKPVERVFLPSREVNCLELELCTFCWNYI